MRRRFCGYIIITLSAILIPNSGELACQEDSARVIDHYQADEGWVVEGVKMSDDPNFGGYERIDLVTYDTSADKSTEVRNVHYRISGLTGLKLLRAETVVNLGFPDYGMLIEYRWTDSYATPRNYFNTVEILQLRKDSVVRKWKYNTLEMGLQLKNMVLAHIDFMQTSDSPTWDIIVRRNESTGRKLHKSHETREIYRYGNDGAFHLVKTESAVFTKRSNPPH